jgi:hypothetical protein
LPHEGLVTIVNSDACRDLVGRNGWMATLNVEVRCGQIQCVNINKGESCSHDDVTRESRRKNAKMREYLTQPTEEANAPKVSLADEPVVDLFDRQPSRVSGGNG